MFIFRKEKRDTSKRSHPVLTKSSLIWIKLQNLTSFSKRMGKKVVCPFIIKELQKYQNLRLTAMRSSGGTHMFENYIDTCLCLNSIMWISTFINCFSLTKATHWFIIIDDGLTDDS